MFYTYVTLSYIIINSILSYIVLKKSGGSVIGRFYTFCVSSIIIFGLSAYVNDSSLPPTVSTVLNIVVDFLFSVIPFFFLHFIVLFLRRYEILRSKWIIFIIYFAGLFSYAAVLGGFLPEPIKSAEGISFIEYIYFVTWMSVFFSIGIAILFSQIRVFAEPKTKSNILLTGFSILLLVLPSPFTYSLSISFFDDNVQWYGGTSIIALIVSVYLLFRHKILVTLYDSVKAALLVMDDLFIMTDENFKIEVVRGALSPMLGYSEKELVNQNLNNYLLDKEYITAYMDYVTIGKMKECKFDTEMMKKNGGTVTVNFSFSPVIENEQIAGFVGIGRDITDRKRAEIELHKSREQYRELVENIREAYYIADSKGRFTYISPNVSLLTGYKPEELLHQSYLRVVSAKDRRRIADFYKTKNNEGTLDTECELQMETKGGKIVWIEQTTRIMRDEQGNILEYRNLVRDVTERNKNNEQKRLLAQALETTSELIWICDQDNRIIHINKAFEQSFGYTQEEIMHRHPIILFSPIHQDTLFSEIFSRKSTKGWSGETACRRKDGTEFQVLLSASTMKNDDGEVAGFIGVARDISEYKSMEEQLRQAQKLEGIGTLAGGVAHDFNNILTIILSYNSLLTRGKLTPERYEEAVKMIRSAVERGAGIVRQLLTIARKEPVEYGPVKINNVVKEMVNFLKETFSKLITIEADLHEAIPDMVADQNQLQQILLNLCINARDAMPEGGTLTMKTKLVTSDYIKTLFPESQDAYYVHLSVSDTGTGIEEAIKQKIFEPFYTTKGVGKGTGLGLAVVYSVVRSHRGFIDLESEIGKGTTFHVFLPIVKHSKDEKALLNDSYQKLLEGKETILLVEDEEALISLVRAELESKGYRVLIARDGVEAVKVFSTNKEDIDLVVSDLGLPKLGGWESYQKMKEIDPAVKAILASGYIESQLQTEMIAAGIKGFINKPYQIEELMERIRRLIDENALRN